MWSWSYGSWNYINLCNQCPSPLTLWVRTLLRWGVLDITLCDKVCLWLAAGQWFSLGTPLSPNNKTDLHNITEILLKVALNTMNPSPPLTHLFTVLLCSLILSVPNPSCVNWENVFIFHWKSNSDSFDASCISKSWYIILCHCFFFNNLHTKNITYCQGLALPFYRILFKDNSFWTEL